jgi:hypothetical protein
MEKIQTLYKTEDPYTLLNACKQHGVNPQEWLEVQCAVELAQAFRPETGRTPPSPMETHAGYCVGESAGRLTSKGTITPEKPGRGYASILPLKTRYQN